MDNFSVSKVNIRLFIGIPIPVNESFTNLLFDLHKQFGNSEIKWLNTSQLHLTLKFIGEVPVFYLNSIESLVCSSIDNIKPFNLIIKNIGFFGSPVPKLVWAGIQSDEVLKKCFYNIDNNLQELGIKKEMKEYKPHITLGRIKFMDKKIKVYDIITRYSNEVICKMKVGKVELIKSTLNQSGPEYKILKTFNL